ncbi:MAG: FAD-dependent monooxygenase [Planctomycetia bacterium]
MIDATVDLAGAATVAWDVLVIGAGPAGAAAALRLVRLGRRVLLVDRSGFPRPKVCGCCLSPAAVRELAALDLSPGRLPPGVPLDSVWIASSGRQARIDTTGGATLSREALDSALVRAAIDEGSAWLPAATVTEIEDTDTGAVATIRGPTATAAAIRANIVVIAAGLADAIRIRRPGAGHDDAATPRPRRIARTSFIGLGATLPADVGELPAGQLVMAVGRAGYAGIVRLEDGRIDLAAAVDPGAISAAGSPVTVIDAILTDVGGIARDSVPGDALATAAVRATPALTHTTPLTAGARGAIIRIGDAAAYVEPFTGEGMGWALASARVLVGSLEAAPSLTGFHAEFTAAHARVFAAHHARCRRVAALVRLPWLFAGAVQAARLSPAVAARTVPWVVGNGRLA